MELRTYIKHFTFEEADRARVELGPNTRINPKTHRAQLGTYGSNIYPTTTNLYVKSWIANPDAVREWQGFDAEILHKKVNGEQVTSAYFRLGDGTNEYYWNGSAWVVSTSNWNTEEEIANNIASFPTTERKLQVIVNLRTSDSTVTPELVEIRVAYGALLDSEEEDMILRTIVRKLKANIRPIARINLVQQNSGTSVDMNIEIDTDYNIVDIDSVFNHTTDPDHNNDIFSSYDPTTKILTLSASVVAGQLMWIRFQYEPIVAISTSRDWYEVEKIPSLILEDVSFTDAVQWYTEDYVGKKSDGTVKVLPGPIQGNLNFTIRGITDKQVDHLRLTSAVKRYFANNLVIVSTGLDERYRLWLVEEYEQSNSEEEKDLHSWVATFRIPNFCVWAKDAYDRNLVAQFGIGGDLDIEVQ